MKGTAVHAEEVRIPSSSAIVEGELEIPANALGIVLFAHGSGSSRHSRRNRYVARHLQEQGLGTLLFDLLTREEESVDRHTAHLRFDIGLLARRLIEATNWLCNSAAAENLPIGYFGASTGGGAALVAAAELGNKVGAVVSRGGRPDLAGTALQRVAVPTLLIVGGRDDLVIELNERAFVQLKCEKDLKIVSGATHLFEEPGALEGVAAWASEWFRQHLLGAVNSE